MQAVIDLKVNVFKVLEDHMSIKDFETWLFASRDFSGFMEDPFVLAVHSFNYKQPDAKYEFRKVIYQFLDEDEFVLWKVKANLADLAADRNDMRRMLNDFQELANNGYTFLQRIANYLTQMEEIDYFRNNPEGLLIELRNESEILLRGIERQEREKAGFRLKDYRAG